MSVRLIVRIDDASMAANVGGAVKTTYKTIDIENNVIEDLLTAYNSGLSHAMIVGAEVIKEEPER